MRFVFEVNDISDGMYSAISYEDYVKTSRHVKQKLNPGFIGIFFYQRNRQF